MSPLATFLRLVTLAIGAGAFGAIILGVFGQLFTSLKVQQLLGFTADAPPAFPAALYMYLVWGGIWGLLLVIPILNRLWWLKGALIGVLATAAIPLYFEPAFAQAPAGRFIYVVVLNIIWGIAAGFWWWLVSERRVAAPRRFGGTAR